MLPRRAGPALRRSRYASVAAAAPTQLQVLLTAVSVRLFGAIGTLRQRQHELTVHRHCFLSASQVLCAQAATAPNSAVGLSVTLPPLCAWGASTDTGCAAEYFNSQHGSRGRTGNGSANRYGDVWAPIESYLAPLSATATDHIGRGMSGTTPAGPSAPLCLVLRLFPDLTIAQLPTLRRRRTESSRAPRHVRSGVVAPHEYPLEVIMGAGELWGGDADPRRVFCGAIDCLHELGQRFLPKLPLVLQLPTRLLVSQQFLHDLATLLARDKWRSVSFELPSTHQLYSCSAEGSSAGVPALCEVDTGAVDATWCQLPLLCTPWPTLCRHPALGRTLRQLRRHDVVPFHVLYSWAVAEQQLFKGLELSIVVDTTAPMPGEEALYAYLQSPASVGRPAEELHGASPLAPRQLRDSTDAAFSFSQSDGEAHRTHRCLCVGENPTTARGAGVSLSNGVIDAVRRRGWSATPRESGKVDFDDAAKAWWLQKCASATSSAGAATAAHTLPAPSENQGDLSLVLDAPPDHLRALIEKSIVDGEATFRCAVSKRQCLLQKVGQFLRCTMEPPAAASGCAAVPTSAATSEDDQSASLEKQAEDLEKLLRGANDATDATAASSDVEMMLAEMQRYMFAHGQPSPCTAEDNAAGRASNGPSSVNGQNTDGSSDAHGAGSAATSNAWSALPGYWSCIHTLVQEVTHATLLWTAPTFNTAAVRAWTNAYHASRRQSVSHGEPCASARGAPLPLVVPVYMPAQSAMHVEVERLLREGRWFDQPPLPRSTEEGEALYTWLPAFLNVALADALSRLPDDYRARERHRLLRDHRRLRKEGAQAARRRASVIEFTAPPPACSAASENEEELCTVRIRINQEALPLYLLTPMQVEKREARALKEAAAACGTGGDEEAQLYAGVHGADKAFTQAVEEGYRAAFTMSDGILGQQALSLSFVHVPTPGLSADQLCRSWHSLSS
ncbi:hypothetical protein GH5_02283 [Leishmania sp. Ghana 2012 LV757]|uniref:hypothetical protein n=1 Tax=Leishmania sp. Ghana 2012 LV757 TaxID=2803181 RepID=UPI001B74F4B8|nr:hypothetical protein GH5_02283 [Leishmania sp. Ghana 2012 LV757]